jgi:hypothetical protein
VVDEDAREPVPDRSLHQGRGHGRVHAARQTAQHPLVADGRADGLDLVLDDVGHRPGRLEPGDVVEEVLEHGLPVLGVQHLGVELHAGELATDVLEGRHRRACGGRRHDEALRGGGDLVAVAHPDELVGRQATEQHRVRIRDGQRGAPELGQARAGHVAPEGLRHRVEPVADAERGDARAEQRGIDVRRSLRVDRRRAARQDDRRGPAGEDLGDRHRVRHDLAVHVRLADPTRDQLRVLRPEVDDEDG